MPKLGDVIGALLADVARARVDADLEAVRVAHAYSADPLLKHLSIPRIRLPEVVVDLPLLVVDVGSPVDRSTGRAAGWSLEQPTVTELSKAIRPALIATRLRLSRADSAAVIKIAVERVQALFARADRSTLTASRVAEVVTEAVVEAVRATPKGEIAEPGLGGLADAARESLTSLLTSKMMLSPSIEVLVSADQLKERADSSNVVRLRLTITEDAYEIVERDGAAGFRLTPE